MATILTAKAVAAKLETDPRTLRKFLRSNDSGIERVGKGNRYEIEAKAVRSLKVKFDRWVAAKAAAAAELIDDADDAENATDAD